MSNILINVFDRLHDIVINIIAVGITLSTLGLIGFALSRKIVLKWGSKGVSLND